MKTIAPDFRGQVMAVEHVERLLRRVTEALRAAEIDYAVIGGNAVAAWVATVDDGAVRATKDVDLLVRRDDLQRISDALAPVALIPIEVLGVSMFVDREKPNPKTGVHILFANEKVRPSDRHPVADVTQSVDSPAGYRVLELRELIAMKLQAYRLIDRVHLLDLRRLGLVESTICNSLPPDLRERWDALEGET
jgi:hypothetical protein